MCLWPMLRFWFIATNPYTPSTAKSGVARNRALSRRTLRQPFVGEEEGDFDLRGEEGALADVLLLVEEDGEGSKHPAMVARDNSRKMPLGVLTAMA
mmetsp:Transcript_92187/g.148846  ORF Transcript_92187/g.148846 Transcript_92187/m.148846 type:complete len:96 (-) Transcript_92187:529-816(-)